LVLLFLITIPLLGFLNAKLSVGHKQPTLPTASLTSEQSATNTSLPSKTIKLTETLQPVFTSSATHPPTNTLPASLTPSPKPFSSGPIKIGESVSGAPIEVFRFGLGSSQRMIIAGIHGGYEWNTIKLARQLIDYIEDNPQIIRAGRTL
jgi:hypothetical protein